MRVLVINSGSSSVKFAVIDTHNREMITSGNIENINAENGSVTTKWKKETKLKSSRSVKNSSEAFEIIRKFLQDHQLNSSIEAIGHRVVHGGKFFHSEKLNPEVVRYLESIISYAPLHQPAHLAGFENAKKFFPSTPQVAVFDTAFHQSIPEKAFLYGIPYSYYKEHQIRRYGFHGSSHRYLTLEAAKRLQKPVEKINLITAHLGNGCSATAVMNGQSVDTTMGFTPLEGLVMGTRSGSLDPAILFFIQQKYGYDMARIDKLLNKESGLLGLSGITNDMRTIIEEKEKGNKRALIAFEVFCYRLAREIGGIAITLPSLDALIFSGGIGENSAPVRKQTLKNLALLGFKTDDSKNKNGGEFSDGIISTEDSPLAMVIPTDEELMIALETENVIIG